MDRRTTKSIKLALQGGGSHGAFTWGVLDHLLEDERVHIEAISGTSAGAMNAVALADGMAQGRTCRSAQTAGEPLVGDQRRGSLQSDPALTDRYADGELEPGQLARLYHDGVSLTPVFAVRFQPARLSTLCAMSSPAASTLTALTSLAA